MTRDLFEIVSDHLDIDVSLNNAHKSYYQSCLGEYISGMRAKVDGRDEKCNLESEINTVRPAVVTERDMLWNRTTSS